METTVAVAAAGASIVSLVFVWLQVSEMKRQTTLQREIAEDAAQPYVWVDVRVQEENGWNLELVLGNSGSTVATDVRVQIEPPFPDAHGFEEIPAVLAMLADGLSSVAPGRSMAWTLGASPTILELSEGVAHRVKVECHGPFGPVSVAEYIIDLNNLRDSKATHVGTLRHVTEAVDRVAKNLEAPKPWQR